MCSPAQYHPAISNLWIQKQLTTASFLPVDQSIQVVRARCASGYINTGSFVRRIKPERITLFFTGNYALYISGDVEIILILIGQKSPEQCEIIRTACCIIGEIILNGLSNIFCAVPGIKKQIIWN